MTAPVSDVVQASNVGNRVELFDVDLTGLVVDGDGAMILHVTSTAYANETVHRGGVPYLPVPIVGEGFDLGSDGKTPQPTLRIANVAGVLNHWIWPTQDMLGAKVTRTVTLKRYLDDEPDEDSSKYLRRDVFTVEQKVRQGPEGAEFRLVAGFDQDGRRVPSRQAFADTCLHRYRRHNGTGFDDIDTAGSGVTCPYKGTTYLDRRDQTTTAANDRCGKRLSSCKLRFTTSPLPTLAFPGIAGRR